MAYEVIARKWRPQKFADVVGQSQITKTLQSELLQATLAHAYLFVGPRGIGKTTIARIFAKAMNCERAPIDEPCCECDSCKSIADGNCIDLIEIDGASNNSVDSMRAVCDEVLYAPVRSRYKVYIIDEVHMLSASAWNALLKTIEEPPPHAKFLFATTEAHKVLPTVVSRCQRFDLRRITFKLIVDQLRKIAVAEGVSVSNGALEVIARAADGGMRDAQSLLDQMIAFSAMDKGEITEEQTLSVFGLTGVAEMENLLTSILRDDRRSVIASIHKIASHGKNLEKLFDDILGFLRGVHICMLMPDPEIVLETGDDMIAMYKKVGAASNADTVHKMLEQLSPVGSMLHNALNKQVFLETILLKAMRVTHAVEIADLIARLNQIRGAGDLKNLEKIPPAAGLAETPRQPDQTPTPDSAPSSEPPSQPSSPSERNEKNEIAPSATPPTPAPAPPPAAAPSTADNWPTPPPKTPLQPSSTIADERPAYSAPAQPQTPPALSATGTLQTEAPSQQQSTPNNLNTATTVEDRNQRNDTPPTPSKTPAEIATPLSPASEQRGAPVQQSSTSQTSPVPNMRKPDTENNPILLTNPVSQAPVASPSASPPKMESPISIWHALTLEMEKCAQPLLKAYMKEGKPKSFANGILSVAFDDEFEAVHIAALLKEKPLLETCLKRVIGEATSLEIIKTKGVASPHGIPVNDDTVKEEIKARADKNPFVQEVLDLFEGAIVDVRG
ncbi:MAG: DNA polymerase III subunit gamma/tau [Kiritimatiellaeota bacterium]|nr:DNA polymerase III subunit gamma/tau [Kiritimatiellota bacterium]